MRGLTARLEEVKAAATSAKDNSVDASETLRNQLTR